MHAGEVPGPGGLRGANKHLQVSVEDLGGVNVLEPPQHLRGARGRERARGGGGEERRRRMRDAPGR